MLIGFTLVLFVFGVSSVVTWTYLAGIRGGNEFIANRVIPAQELCISINDNVYELFMAMRLFQIEETTENAAVVRQWSADTQRVMNDISALYATAPEVEALQPRCTNPRLNYIRG